MEFSDAKVLVVDDESALREIFSKWLTGVGCKQVATAGDGEEALAMVQTTRFDLMISDVRMPKMDGITLVRRLAGLGQSIPSIIFVSGFGDVDEREMYGQGVEAFLAKPLRMEDLLAVIRRALADRSSLWRTPMEVAPRQSMLVQGLVGLDAEEGDGIRLGRGGFSVRFERPLSLGKVAFRCTGPDHHDVLSGQGMVRWRSKTDQRVGIEFAYLEEASRGRVLEVMAKAEPRCFIPA